MLDLLKANETEHTLKTPETKSDLLSQLTHNRLIFTSVFWTDFPPQFSKQFWKSKMDIWT